MKKKLKVLIAISLLMICMSSCVYSLFPIYTEDTLVFIPELIGKWQAGNDPEDYILIEKMKEEEKASSPFSSSKEPEYTDSLVGDNWKVRLNGPISINIGGKEITDRDSVWNYYNDMFNGKGAVTPSIKAQSQGLKTKMEDVATALTYMLGDIDKEKSIDPAIKRQGESIKTSMKDVATALAYMVDDIDSKKSIDASIKKQGEVLEANMKDVATALAHMLDDVNKKKEGNTSIKKQGEDLKTKMKDVAEALSYMLNDTAFVQLGEGMKPLLEEAAKKMEPMLKEAAEAWEPMFKEVEKRTAQFKGAAYVTRDESYKMIVMDNGERSVYQVHVVAIGEDYFMDLYPLPEFSNNAFQSNLFPVHTFMKVNMDDGKMVLTMFDLDKLNDLFESNLIRLRHEIVDGTVLITAQPKEIQKFLDKYSNDESVFEDIESYRRVG